MAAHPIALERRHCAFLGVGGVDVGGEWNVAEPTGRDVVVPQDPKVSRVVQKERLALTTVHPLRLGLFRDLE